MGDLRIRNIDDDIKAMLKSRAKHEGVTIEQLARSIITDAVLRPRREYVAEVNTLRESIRRSYGTFSDSTPAIREERDKRG